MNRKKKINQTLKQKAKKANAKLHTRNKPKYIAKAERDGLAKAVGDGIAKTEDLAKAVATDGEVADETEFS